MHKHSIVCYASAFSLPCKHSHHYQYSAVHFRDIIWIQVVATLYMAVPIEEVNDAITFEQSTFY